MQRPKRVMIISFDAVGSQDLPFLRTLPNFSAFFQDAALFPRVRSTYPSLTYPAHTSIITGRMPINHGVTDNTKLDPKRECPDWICQRRFIRGATLYDEAGKKGIRTAALLWPVVGRSGIPYAVPEVMATRRWQTQLLVNAMNGPLGYQLDLNRRFGYLRDGIRQPALDHFIQACALYTIRTYRPGLFLLHLTDVDTHRHLYGVSHEKVTEALRRHDRRLGELLEALRQTGEMEETTVILLGDHYQKDVRNIAFVNHILLREGLMTEKNGKIKSWKAFVKGCGGSAYVYRNPKDRKDPATEEKLMRILQDLLKREDYGIGRIFTNREAQSLGADPTCFAMLEAKEGWCFLDDWRQESKDAKLEKGHAVRGSHGYLTAGEEDQTFFAAKGCGIRPGIQQKEIALWDEGPTLAALMGLDLGETDGTVQYEMLL